MSELVGEVAVRVRPDVARFREDAQREVDRAVQNVKAEVQVNVDRNRLLTAGAGTSGVEARQLAAQAVRTEPARPQVVDEGFAARAAAFDRETAAIRENAEAIAARNEETQAAISASGDSSSAADEAALAQGRLTKSYDEQVASARRVAAITGTLLIGSFALGRVLGGASEAVEAFTSESNDLARGLGDAGDAIGSLATGNVGGFIRATQADSRRAREEIDKLAASAKNLTQQELAEATALDIANAKLRGQSEEARKATDAFRQEQTARIGVRLQIDIEGTDPDSRERARALTEFARETSRAFNEFLRTSPQAANPRAVQARLKEVAAAWNAVREEEQAIDRVRLQAHTQASTIATLRAQLAGNEAAEKRIAAEDIRFFQNRAAEARARGAAARAAAQAAMADANDRTAAARDVRAAEERAQAAEAEALRLQVEQKQQQEDQTNLLAEIRLGLQETIAGLTGTEQDQARAQAAWIAYHRQRALDATDRVEAAQQAAAAETKAAQATADAERRRAAEADATISRARAAAQRTEGLADDARVDSQETAELRRQAALKTTTKAERIQIQARIDAIEGDAVERERQAALKAEQNTRAINDARIAAARARADRTSTISDDIRVDAMERTELRRRLASALTTAAERTAIFAQLTAIELAAQERERQYRLLLRQRRESREDLAIERRKLLAQFTKTTADDAAALQAEIRLWQRRASDAKKSGDLVALAGIRNHILEVRLELKRLKAENDQLQTDAFSIFKEMQRTFTEFAPNVQLGATGTLTGVLGRTGAPAVTGQPSGPVTVNVNQTFPAPTPNRFREIQYAAHAAKAFFDAGF